MREKRSMFGTRQARAQRGASMPLALLLFLICAMTAAIVLAAGTVSAGRASNLSEADQAYYSVTSAVNLFREQLDNGGKGHPVTVAVKKDSSGSSAASYQVVVTTDGKTAGSSYSLLERAAMYLLFGGRSATDNNGAQAAAKAVFTSSNAWDDWPDYNSFGVGDVASFAVEHSAAALNAAQKDALDLQAVASITPDGSLVLAFQKQNDRGDYLALFNLTCDADIETGVLESADADAGSEIKYATVTWMPSIVEKG